MNLGELCNVIFSSRAGYGFFRKKKYKGNYRIGDNVPKYNIIAMATTLVCSHCYYFQGRYPKGTEGAF